LSEQHRFIRRALKLMEWAHQKDLTKLRFMLESTDQTCTIHFGARRFFAQADGLFIPADMRHRTIKITLGCEPPTPARLLEQLHAVAVDGTLTEVDDESEEGFSLQTEADDGLKGGDYKYGKWFASLVDLLEQYPLALPRRSQEEHLVASARSLSIAFLESPGGPPLAPIINFPAPPGGLLLMDAPLGEVAPEIRVAQSRDPDAPNLLWDFTSGPTRDQTLDRLYEDL
jgi:hypothetical protein